MIKLSSLLEHILDHPMKGEAMQEAKRLERIDECSRLTHLEITSDVSNTELKPLLYGDGDGLYAVVDSCGHVCDCSYERKDMESVALEYASLTGKPHTVCQIMAPVNGECPTIPVATFTPESPHEWVIYNANGQYEGRWFAMSGCIKYWASEITNKEAQRFATAAEAQDYIDKHNITNAFPWPIPKLSEK